MRVTVQTSADRVKVALGLYIQETGVAAAEAVHMAARGVTTALLKMTPPFATLSPSENFGTQKKIGDFAVARDISRAFRALEDLNAYQASHSKRVNDNFQAALNKHDPTKMSVLLTALRYPNVTPDRIVDEASVPRHDELRQKGRVPKKARGFFIFKADSIDQLEKLRLHAVGRGKSGWLAAADALGISVPAWISRHGPNGTAINHTGGPINPTFRATNSVEYLADFSGSHRLVALALDRETGNLERALKAHHLGLWKKRK